MNPTQRPFRHRSTDRAFLSISAVAVAIAIIAGFWLLGSPGQQRLLSLDSERINDLTQIAGELSYTVNNPDGSTAPPLPQQLPDSVTTRADLTDPVTREPYEYRRLSDSSYELCATFATDSKEQDSTQPTSLPPFVNARWSHSAGRHCFEIAKSATEPKP